MSDDTKLNLLKLRRDFYNERGLGTKIKQLEDKNVRDKEKEDSKKAGKRNISKDKWHGSSYNGS